MNAPESPDNGPWGINGTWSSLADGWNPPPVDTGTPSVARMYDFFLGGKDNYPADRRAAFHILTLFPWVRDAARANRRFLVRAVEHVAQQGVCQFIDVGTGIPTSPNVDEVAHRVNKDARIACVDNDPLVLTYARALLGDEGRSTPDVRTIVVDGDLRDPDTILSSPKLRDHLDLSRPVGVLMVAVLHFLTDDEARAAVTAFRAVMAPGSYLVISHATPSPPEQTDAMREAISLYVHQTTTPLIPRTAAQIADLFDGFDLIGPGLVPLDAWKIPDQDTSPPAGPPTEAASTRGLAGVGRLAATPPT